MDLNPLFPTHVVPVDPSTIQSRPFGPNTGPGMTNRAVSEREVSMERLSGRPDPKRDAEVLKWEKPWMVNAAFMWASGKYDLQKIARAQEVSYSQVVKLAKQPWFQEKVGIIQRENGAGDIMDTFRAECQNSLVTLIEIRDDVKAPASVRRASAIDILHQVLGKPTQKVEMEQTVTSVDPVAEAERLERENNLLRGSPPGDKTDSSPSSNP